MIHVYVWYRSMGGTHGHQHRAVPLTLGESCMWGKKWIKRQEKEEKNSCVYVCAAFFCCNKQKKIICRAIRKAATRPSREEKTGIPI